MEELFASANLAFRICPMLTQGATEAIAHCGSAAQQDQYLPRMVRGEWTGTMNLTEPQAGSDLALVRTRAIPRGDHYLLLARRSSSRTASTTSPPTSFISCSPASRGRPAGVKGISLFIVPKFLVNDDGSLGARNDLQCVSIEHKLGIRAQPHLHHGLRPERGAVGYLLGEANRGLEYMFMMMNAARLSVGLEGYAVARACLSAGARLVAQPGTRPPAGAAGDHSRPAPIIAAPRRAAHAAHHEVADRGHALSRAVLGLAARRGCAAHDAAQRQAAKARGELLIPIVKGWCTETGVELASLGIQVHGGMGFIEDTGAAQALRDARIGPIYEGTTGIQALDLIGRKLARDGGAALAALVAEIHAELAAYRRAGPLLESIARAADEAVALLESTVRNLLNGMAANPAVGAAVAVPLLRMAGISFGGWLQARAAHRANSSLAQGGADPRFLEAKLDTARFYAQQILPVTAGLALIVRGGAGSVLDSDSARL